MMRILRMASWCYLMPSATQRSGHSAPLVFIEAHRQDDDAADDDLLHKRRDAEQIAAIVQQPHDHGADDGADHRSLPSVQTAAADDDRRDNVQFVAGPGSRLTGDQ